MPGGGALLKAPSGATRVAAVIGDPVAHSLSPAMHNAAFQALGLDWVYTAFRVRRGRGAAAVEAMRVLDLAGMSVTMPHKADVAAAVDTLGPVSAKLGVVNTVSWSARTPGLLVGESTDGAGFLDAVADEGFDVRGARCVVFGSGGAARAVTDAASRAGAAGLVVVARNVVDGESCATLAGSTARAVSAADRAAVEGAVREAELVVNATPVGMDTGSDATTDGDLRSRLAMGVVQEWFASHQLVVDLVYHPASTPLMRIAAAAGARSTNGLGMLVHQARRQVELWTGQSPPTEVLVRAANEAVLGAISESR